MASSVGSCLTATLPKRLLRFTRDDNESTNVGFEERTTSRQGSDDLRLHQPTGFVIAALRRSGETNS